MSRFCIITGKSVLSGQNRSHAENKTKRKFLPNIQKQRFQSLILNEMVTIAVSAKGIRTLEKKGGLDSFLLNTSNSRLTDEALKIKKRLLKKSA